MDDYFGVRAVREYQAANPDDPEVIEFQTALAKLRAGLLDEIAAIKDPFIRTAEAIRWFGRRGPGLIEDRLG